jgi:hypothetical protein
LKVLQIVLKRCKSQVTSSFGPVNNGVKEITKEILSKFAETPKYCVKEQ